MLEAVKKGKVINRIMIPTNPSNLVELSLLISLKSITYLVLSNKATVPIADPYIKTENP